MENNLDLRDYYATEILKTFLSAQGKQWRMTPISRIVWWLGFNNGWKAHINYNYENSVKESYKVADLMIKER